MAEFQLDTDGARDVVAVSTLRVRFVLPASLAFAASLGSVGWAQVTQRVSVGSDGSQANGACLWPSLTPNGRYVAFSTYANNLVPGDTNPGWDVFLRDRRSGTTELISLDSSGVQGNGQSLPGVVSADARFVAFSSYASNLVGGDTNGAEDVFIRDRSTNTTERVSISSTGSQANDSTSLSSITPDGRYVAMVSWATNLVPHDANFTADLFIRDRLTGTTELLRTDSAGGRMSADGRYVLWASFLSGGPSDLYLADRQNATNELVNVDSSELPGNAPASVSSISPDARFISFLGYASNLVANDTNGVEDIFLRDRTLGTTERVSVDSSGGQANDGSWGSSVSADGRFVTFSSFASNLVPGDTNGRQDVFLRDRLNGTTVRLSVDPAGAQANYGAGENPSISPDGRYVVFDSMATNLVPGDSNGLPDVFVRDLLGGPAFTSLCAPGVNGVMACPCGNPPNGPDRGCDNSSGTGGASLSASGGTFLSSDTLQFTTTGERPSALSIVTQWTGTSATGAVLGMGVRCTSGTVERLYAKVASGGSILAPDFAAGDAQVSLRSKTLGDVIQPAESRWYVVYYRDPIVLGGCPANSTFNSTQTGRVSWAP